jgi:glycosyltransferase involved in cell wall biosynthesis
MQDFPERPPIAAAPLSIILTSPRADAERDEALRDWVTYLNGLEQEYEVLLVNESADRPAQGEADKSPRVQALAPYGRAGFGAALRLGLENARHPLVFYARCDGRYKPADLKQLLKWIDRVDLAVGQRVFPAAMRRRRLKGMAYRLGYRLVSGVRLRDVECLFVLARRSIFSRIIIQCDSVFAHGEVLAKANFLGYLMTEVPVAYRPRSPDEGGDVSGDWRAIRTDAKRVYNDPEFGLPPAEAPPPESGTAKPQA